MNLLALDTSMAACSAAILDTQDNRVVAQRWQAMERGHAEAIAPMIADLLHEAGLAPAALGRIAVTAGPGTFTGVRIGLSMARGLGLALGIPVTGLDTLAAIAANAPEARSLLVLADARNGEVYAAGFGPGLARRFGPEVLAAEAAAGRIGDGDTLLGTGADRVLALARTARASRPAGRDLPEAAGFARLAARLPPAADMPQPLYLRAADATPQSLGIRDPVVIRLAEAGEAAVLAALHAESFERAWGAAEIAALLALPGTEAVVALAGSEPLAFLMTRRAADEAEILTVATRPGARRRGLARRLLDRQSTELLGRGVRALFLEVAASNAQARALYAAAGFAPAGLRRNYYDRGGGLREDAVVMRRELGAR